MALVAALGVSGAQSPGEARASGGAVAYPVAPQGWAAAATRSGAAGSPAQAPAAVALALSQERPSVMLSSASGMAEAAGYRLAAGDLVRITVYQNPDLTLESRLTDTGTLSFPLVGVLQLGGLGIAAAERRVAEALRQGQFVRQPQVSIALLEVRGHQASVLGQVNRPGRYPIEVTTLRLSDLLALAGGTSPGGADRVVVAGLRDGQPFRAEVDLPSLFGPDGRERDLFVRHGDTVWVDRQPQFYIYGQVQRPGALRLERGMTLMQALATGGGLTPRGTDKGIRIHRRGADGRMSVLRLSMHEPVLEGDVVHVAESLF
jgi:polysaccharide export outer membrane protein